MYHVVVQIDDAEAQSEARNKANTNRGLQDLHGPLVKRMLKHGRKNLNWNLLHLDAGRQLESGRLYQPTGRQLESGRVIQRGQLELGRVRSLHRLLPSPRRAGARAPVDSVSDAKLLSATSTHP